MINPLHPLKRPLRRGFTLVEMLVVMIIIAILLVAAGVLFGSGSSARKTAVDVLAGMVDQARSTAITSRHTVVLAIAEPADLGFNDSRCRVGLFQVDKLDHNGGPSDARMIRRWEPLPVGIVLLGGAVDGVRNPLDETGLMLNYSSAGQAMQTNVHALAFTARGGLSWPDGSDPMVVRVADGGYRGGKAQANRSGNDHHISEERLRVGRVVARPWRIDG